MVLGLKTLHGPNIPGLQSCHGRRIEGGDGFARMIRHLYITVSA